MPIIFWFSLKNFMACCMSFQFGNAVVCVSTDNFVRVVCEDTDNGREVVGEDTNHGTEFLPIKSLIISNEDVDSEVFSHLNISRTPVIPSVLKSSLMTSSACGSPIWRNLSIMAFENWRVAFIVCILRKAQKVLSFKLITLQSSFMFLLSF